MISVSDAVKVAGFLMEIIQALRSFAEAKGMEPAEFNRSASQEATRLDAWLSDLLKDGSK